MIVSIALAALLDAPLQPQSSDACSLASGGVAGRVDFVAVLLFGTNKKTGDGLGGAIVQLGFELPDHAAFADTGVGEPGPSGWGVGEEFVFAAAGQWVGGGFERALGIQSEQAAAVFDRKRGRAGLAEVNANPPGMSGGNEVALRRVAADKAVERGRTEGGSHDEKNEDRDTEDEKKQGAGGFVRHASGIMR